MFSRPSDKNLIYSIIITTCFIFAVAGIYIAGNLGYSPVLFVFGILVCITFCEIEDRKILENKIERLPKELIARLRGKDLGILENVEEEIKKTITEILN